MNCVLLPENSPLSLPPDSPKLAHIRGVLGTCDGGEIFVGNINGGLRVCKIAYRPDGGAEFSPVRELPVPEPLEAAIAVAFPRPQIAQRILFEAACAGIRKLVFYPATKGEAAYAQSSLYKSGEYSKWLEKGAEQACATFVPTFRACLSPEEAADECAATFADPVKLAPDPYEATDTLVGQLAKSARSANAERGVSAMLGGERGFADSDRKMLRGRGWTLVSLGKRILRTDTAFITVCALVAGIK